MLTPREQDTYQFISNYLLKHQKPPLLSEIAEGLGIQSKGVIHRYLSALEEQGYIQPVSYTHLTLPTTPYV